MIDHTTVPSESPRSLLFDEATVVEVDGTVPPPPPLPSPGTSRSWTVVVVEPLDVVVDGTIVVDEWRVARNAVVVVVERRMVVVVVDRSVVVVVSGAVVDEGRIVSVVVLDDSARVVVVDPGGCASWASTGVAIVHSVSAVTATATIHAALRLVPTILHFVGRASARPSPGSYPPGPPVPRQGRSAAPNGRLGQERGPCVAN